MNMGRLQSLYKHKVKYLSAFGKVETQRTDIHIKLNTVQCLQGPKYTSLLKPNHNLEFQVQYRIHKCVTMTGM